MAPAIKLTPSYAGMYVATPAATTIAVADTPVKAAGTTAAIMASSDFTVGTANRITYTGATVKKVKVDVAATLTPAGGTNADYIVQLYKYDTSASSGALVASSKITGRAAAVEPINVACTGLVELDTGDYIEVWVGNLGATDNVSLTRGVVTCVGLEA